MGGGSYSMESRSLRSAAMGYDTRSRAELFEQRQIHNQMSPHGVDRREARDSEEHPQSLPIILGLDVTGSMGNVPHQMVRSGLPTLMSTLIQAGTIDPALMFMGIGDHEVDNAPLQIGQFEADDAKLDAWLTQTWLEGGGGGNRGESYMLAWYFAAWHTASDHWDKRGQKGFLFTVGDEPVLPKLHGASIQEIMGLQQASDMPSPVLLDEARERWQVYHLHLSETASGRRPDRVAGWQELLGDHLLQVQHHSEVPEVIAETILGNQTEPSSKPSKDEDGEGSSTETDIIL